MINRLFPKILASSLGIAVCLICMSAYAQDKSVTTTTTTSQDPVSGETTTVVQKKTIITPAPKSVSCTTLPGHWEDNVWIDVQTVCKYAGRSEGSEWVQDYWACTVFTASGNCQTWEYRPGHWIQATP